MDRKNANLSSSARAERQVGNTGRKIHSDRSLGRQRLEDDGWARAPDQDVRAETATQCEIAARAHIVAAQRAGVLVHTSLPTLNVSAGAGPAMIKGKEGQTRR